MYINTFQTIMKYSIELFFSVCLILIIYIVIRTVTGYINNQRRGGVDFGGDLERAVMQNAVEEMAVTTVRDSNGYIQNNNMLIENRLKVFTPNFSADHFNRFAAGLFTNLVKAKGTQNTPLVSQKANSFSLPDSIAGFDGCYLHNYIIQNNTESLKLFCTVITADSEKESYFITFSRENPLIYLRDGKILTVSCPNCGAGIDMDKKLVSECPYCHSTITFAESDWALTDVEHITPDTQICNIAMVKS